MGAITEDGPATEDSFLGPVCRRCVAGMSVSFSFIFPGQSGSATFIDGRFVDLITYSASLHLLHYIHLIIPLQSLNTGRPPSFSLAYIDCSFPQPDEGSEGEGAEGGFGTACEPLPTTSLTVFREL
jgi:hypothetical protein